MDNGAGGTQKPDKNSCSSERELSFHYRLDVCACIGSQAF